MFSVEKNAGEYSVPLLSSYCPLLSSYCCHLTVVAHEGDNKAGIGVEQHMRGEMAMQIGMAFVGLVGVLEMKGRKPK